jgi:uncharacterized membrane protein
MVVKLTTSYVLRLQGAYYLVTGLSPFVSMRAFEKITGKKTDRWLVQMVGLLAASVGISLMIEGSCNAVGTSSLVLSLATASAFAGIDIVHVARRRISPVYLADAAAEALIVSLLLVAKRR